MERKHKFYPGDEEREVITPLEFAAIPETPADLSQVWTTPLQKLAAPEVAADVSQANTTPLQAARQEIAKGLHKAFIAPLKLKLPVNPAIAADLAQAWTTPVQKVTTPAPATADDVSEVVTARLLRVKTAAHPLRVPLVTTPKMLRAKTILDPIREVTDAQNDLSQAATTSLPSIARPVKPKIVDDLSQAVTTQLAVILLKSKKNIKSKKTLRVKVIYIALIMLLLFGTFGSLLGFSTYQSYSAEYQRYLSDAQAGIQHLQTAESLMAGLAHNPFDANSVAKAQKEFIAASNDLVQVDNGLKAVPNLATYIPSYGVKLRAALELLPLAIEATQAGEIGSNVLTLLIARFHDPTNVNSQGLTLADMTTIRNDFQQVEAIFYQLIDQVNHLSPSDTQLDPRVGKLLSSFHTYLPTLLSSLNDVDSLLSVLPLLLGIGKPTNYLVEVLDSTELRPGGGFIGNYGILTLSNGRESDAHITDVDLLDRPFEAAGHVIAFPSAYSWFDISPGSWSLRDTNLDADFPTVAHYSEQNYKLEGGNVPFQGVIAITPVLIQHMLQITGPINVPEYHEIITAQNLIARIHYHQLAASEGVDTLPASDGQSSQRKHFTALLAEHFLARIHQLGASALPQLMQLMISSLHTKDLQIYLNSSVAESFLQRLHIDATIQSPPGDSLFVVDANIAADKANPYIIDTLNDAVTIDSLGNATHQTTLTYAWKIPGQIYGNSPYRDYMRIYVPPGSILHAASGFEPRGTSKAFGRTVWAGFFTLNFGQTRTITLRWTVPKAAIKGPNGWHYQFLLQRQAGTVWNIHLHLALPTCAVVKATSGVLVYTHKSLYIGVNSLIQDTNVGADYTC